MKSKITTLLFLITESILFYIIMTKGGALLIWSSFVSIVLCFLFALFKKAEKHILTALLFTVFADFFLVVVSPIERLYGMIFFALAQSLYALFLYKKTKSKSFLKLRVIFVLTGFIVCFFVLKENADLLSLLSVYYYCNLIISIIQSFCSGKKYFFFALGLCLLLLCDTIIGLQVAADLYLPIKEGSFIYNIIFTDFFLSWFFYLPSQVIISLFSSFAVNKKRL